LSRLRCTVSTPAVVAGTPRATPRSTTRSASIRWKSRYRPAARTEGFPVRDTATGSCTPRTAATMPKPPSHATAARRADRARRCGRL